MPCHILDVDGMLKHYKLWCVMWSGLGPFLLHFFPRNNEEETENLSKHLFKKVE